MSPSRRKYRITRKTWTVVLIIGICLVLFGGAFLGVIFHDVSAMASGDLSPNQSTIVYGDDGKVVAEIHGPAENRTPVALEQIPQHVLDAVVAVEDNLFFTHHGVSVRSIARSVFQTVQGNRQGASTITMQLAKIALTGSEQTWIRKIKQTILALELERKYTKNEILEMYLNWVYMGHGAAGVQAAANVYFGKDVSKLTVAEGAMIAGIIQLPSVYSPYDKPEKAKARQEIVLDQMVKYGKLTEAQAAAAKKEPIVLRKGGLKSLASGGYFVDYVLQQLLDKYGSDKVYNSGLRVYTTVDIDMQIALEKAMSTVLDAEFPIVEGKPPVQAAGVFIDHRTGEIKAIAGGRKYDQQLGLNRAVASFRQPGSAFKPIADYTAALDLGMSAGDLLDDKPIQFPGQDGKPWQPKNYDGVYKGLMTLREAVMDSRNSPAIQTLNRITPDVGFQYAMRLGNFSRLKASGTLNDKTLSLAIGGLTVGVSPLELVSAYGVLANGGVRFEPISILKVTDRDGNVLEENTSVKTVAISEQTAFLMTDVLRSVVTGGTGQRAALDRPTAGKTGTTDDTADAWWVGYTPELVGGVWMGYDQPKGMNNVAGGRQPAAIWKATMQAGLVGKPVVEFPVPANITTGVTICGKSGKIPTGLCPADDLRVETYLAGREPNTTCDVHVMVRVCAEHPDRLASASCPTTVTKLMTRRPIPYEPVTLVLTNQVAYPNDWSREAPTIVCEFHGGGALPPSGPPRP